MNVKEKTMKGLLLVAHGSTRKESNDEIRSLTEKMILPAKSGNYGKVSCAFLELEAPSIPEGIQNLIDDGIDEVVVMPYFLAAGRHVTEDIPAEIAKVQSVNPDKNIKMVNHLGSTDGLAELILNNI